MAKVLVIEITDTEAKVLQASEMKNVITLEHAQRVSFEDLDKSDEAMVERKNRLTREIKKIKTLAPDMILVIPKQCVILRKTMLPTGDPVELANMVVFEAEKLIRINAERHTLSYALTEGLHMEGTEVMISAIDEPVIMQFIDMVSAIRAEPKQVDISSLAFAHSAFIELAEGDMPEVYALLQIGMASTDVSIVYQGKLLTTRSIPRVGAQQLLDSIPGDSSWESWLQKNLSSVFENVEEARQPIEVWFSKLMTQYRRTIEFAQRDHPVPVIKNVYVCGEAAAIPGFQTLFSTHMGMPAPVINPLEKVAVAKDGNVDKNCLPVFTAAYGSANRFLLYPEIDSINLLPVEIIEHQQVAERRMHLSITGLIAIVALVMAFLYMNGNWQHQNTEVENISSYLDDLDLLVEQLDDREERIEIIRQIRSEQAGALDILGRISAYPKVGSYTMHDGRLTISDFEFELADKVRIDGYAMDTEDITQFVRYLSGLQNEKKSIFESVDIQSQDPTNLPRREDNIYKFRIEALLRAS